MEIERRLSDVLREFARTLATDFPIQAILDQLVGRIVDVLPVDAAGVTLIAPGSKPRYVTASDSSALRFEQLQTELGEGPCLAAFNTGQAVTIADLDDDDRFPKFAERALAEGLRAVFTFPLRQENHQFGALDLYRTTPGGLDDEALAAAQSLADVAAAYLLNAEARAELQESSERARQTSLHDALTGLPNRSLLVDHLKHAIDRCSGSALLVAILFVDLDHFKAINDTHGHHVGDELLVAVAERLNGVLRSGDTLARLAGDEFVILCEDLADAAQVEPIAARIDRALNVPFVLSGVEVETTASVGIAFAGKGGDVPEQVLRDADIAMYQAKRKGGARHGVIDLREQRLADHRASLNRDLRHALARNELRLDYQPIVATAEGRITGAEALLRWTHPTRGLIGPDTIIPLAEQSGHIAEIGRWALHQACADRRRWSCPGNHGELEVSVNVSVRQLMGLDFVATVASVLANTSFDPNLLTLEVTESVFIDDFERAVLTLNDLKALGVKLALDDFGTGFSSLSHLQRFPVDVVKIDKTFVAGLDLPPVSHLIVTAMTGLAHSLGMTVVAEGVETHNQYQAITAVGCDAYQGFYFARPASADQLASFIADCTPLPARGDG